MVSQVASLNTTTAQALAQALSAPQICPSALQNSRQAELGKEPGWLVQHQVGLCISGLSAASR